jgi:lipid-A-disaccharide synthase
MQHAGLERVVRAEDVAHMGITEVVRHAPFIYAQYRRLVAAIELERPDVAVLIDFPDVNFRLAKHLRRLGVPIVWFVSPQLWAWKRSRLRWVQQRVDKMLVIFPFEERFYRERGVDAEFVGHPLAAAQHTPLPREVYAAQHHLDPAKTWIALLHPAQAAALPRPQLRADEPDYRNT